MATTDPVNAAVARALAYGTDLVKSGQSVDFAPRNILPWAAREALAPIRELVEAHTAYHQPRAERGVLHSQGVMHLIRDLTPLLYTTEELNR